MTIGIAAYGPGAGRAILQALAAVEAVGRGAIGGFVSFVVLDANGEVERAETQTGGTAALFPGMAIPAALAEARIAGLMSSGPNRPVPLSQFTPALAGVGLVTGHRLPNTIGAAGISVAEEALMLMAGGLSARDAAEQAAALNPDIDAGLITLSASQGLHAVNTELVGRRGDTGMALRILPGGSVGVAVLHNAIHPAPPLAALAAEVALDVMAPADRYDSWITLRAGAPLFAAKANAVRIGGDGVVEALLIQDRRFLSGCWGLGLGDAAPVLEGASVTGVMVYEPYLTVADGRLTSVDGQAEQILPMRRHLSIAAPSRASQIGSDPSDGRPSGAAI